MGFVKAVNLLGPVVWALQIHAKNFHSLSFFQIRHENFLP